MMPKLFPPNEHVVDRAIRVLLGVALLATALTGGTAWGYAGIVPLVTGLLGSCPIYTVLGFSTCPLKATARRI